MPDHAQQLATYQQEYDQYREMFLSDGVISPEEQEYLDSISAMMTEIRNSLPAASESTPRRSSSTTASSSDDGGVCEPVRPSEVISGASSGQYSTGEVSYETMAEDHGDFATGVRENAAENDHNQAPEYQGTSYAGEGSHPMQSPNLPTTFAKRYGIGFLCSNYNNWNDLADIRDNLSPSALEAWEQFLRIWGVETNAYLRAFSGMDRTQQYENPTSAQIRTQVSEWVDRLAGDLGECEQGELVVSFQGHGEHGSIYGVDEQEISTQEMQRMSRDAEAKRVSITWVLDACFSGAAVPAFQDAASDRVDEQITNQEMAGNPETQTCSEDDHVAAEALRDILVHARGLADFSRSLSRYGQQIGDSDLTMQASSTTTAAHVATENTNAVNLNNEILGVVRQIQTQFEYNFPQDAMYHNLRMNEVADAIDRYLTQLATIPAAALGAYPNQIPNVPSSLYSSIATVPNYNTWQAEFGRMQDTISDGANRVIQYVNSETR